MSRSGLGQPASRLAGAAAGLLLLCAGGCRPTPRAVGTPPDRADEPPLARALRRVTRQTEWRLVATTPLAFDAFHPQGLARVAGALYLSTVEILEPPRRIDRPSARATDRRSDRPVDRLIRGSLDGYPDRTPGRGVGHLVRLDPAGRAAGELRLGEGDAYHPGGIDAARGELWVPVAEYRPGSRSVIYRIDAAALAVRGSLRVADHVGAVALEPEGDALTALTWGARRLLRLTPGGRSMGPATANPGQFVDWQDCQGLGARLAICGGVSVLHPGGGAELELGGLALVDLARGAILYEVPVDRYSPQGHAVTRNAVLLELDGPRLLLRAVPDDDRAALLTYEAR